MSDRCSPGIFLTVLDRGPREKLWYPEARAMTRRNVTVQLEEVVEAAARAGAIRLLTEDLQDGRRFGGITIANPFHVT